MNRWDKLEAFMDRQLEKKGDWAQKMQVNRNKIGYLFDKHQLIRKMFIVGIFVNCYLVYNNSAHYFHVCELNEKVIENNDKFMERVNARKYQILDSAKAHEQLKS